VTPRPRLAAALALTLPGCLGGPQLVAIRPSFGYLDGCTPVVVSGSALGTDATLTLGGTPMLDVVAPGLDPARPAHAQDVGFRYDALTPPRSGAETGFVDLVLTVSGRALTLPDAFYYVACPGTVHVDAATPDADLTPGDTVALDGCGLDVDGIVGRLVDDAGAAVASLALASVCGTGRASFAVPDVPAGDYWIELVADDGTTWGGACLAEPGDSGDESAVADTADPCAGLVRLSVVAAVEGE
jgi:hypothetical protein